MANETRPRRESSSTSRIRKAAPISPGGPTPPPSAADENGTVPPVGNSTPTPETPAGPAMPGDYRARLAREPSPQERPADREPIRYVRDREPIRERGERESGLPV